MRRAAEHQVSAVRKLMATGLSADEYAARHGRLILVYGYHTFAFEDPEVHAWAHRLGEVLFTPGLLEACEERWLTPDELEEVRSYEMIFDE